MNERSAHQFWGMLVLSLALVLSALIAAGAIRQVKRSADTITVTGSAKKPIRSDYVIWRGSVGSQQPTLEGAYLEVSRSSERLRRYFADHQIPDSVITLRPLETRSIQEMSEKGRGATGRIMAYSLRQTFEIRSDQVDEITALAGHASELISEGVAVESYPLEYLYTKLAELRSAMLADAAADARRRAESIASSVGSKIGPVRSARMGVFQITARNSTEISDYGRYDTSALDKDITAVVSITFAVK